MTVHASNVTPCNVKFCRHATPLAALPGADGPQLLSGDAAQPAEKRFT